MDIHRKVAKGPSGADDLRRQAELLAAARHPGVVELVGLEGSTDRPVLVTAMVDGPTLAAPPPLAVEEIAGLVREVAATLADLHELGIVHGAVAPEHVLLDAGGRPVLCGFGAAGRVGDDDVHPSTDVAGLGRLLRRLAVGPEARALRRVAEAATTDDPGSRPSARDVADALTREVPDARLPAVRAPLVERGAGHDLRSLMAGARPDRRRSRDGRRPRRTVVVAVGSATTVVAAGLLLSAPWASSGPVAERSAAAPTSLDPSPTSRPALPPTTAALPTTTIRVTSAQRTDCPVPASVLVADVDGDGCLDGLRYADGVLEATGLRWALGQAGDQIATGDWACRGSRTVVLLRPSTGQLFRFDGWAAAPAGEVTGTVVATVPGGQAVRAADVDRDGCHEVVVERGELPPQVVRLPRPPT